MQAQPIKMSQRFSCIFRSLIPVFLVFLFVNCSGGGSGSAGLGEDLPIGVAPTFLIETATEGTLRAELMVYGPDGNVVHSEDLRINVDTGEVFSSQFKLDRGFTYTFLITFYFSKPGTPELPVAMVLKSLSTDDSFLSVSFEASEVLTSLAQLNPALAASVSQSILPNLDADDDGFSNFAEILEGSDPYDANDVPLPPQIEGEPVIESFDDYVEFRVVFTDTSGIGSIKPVGDLVCGYFEWEVTPLDAKGKRTELHIKFNLYSHMIADGDTVHFQYQVSDKLGISAVHTVSVADVGVADTIPSNLNRPEILVVSPEEGQSVSDYIYVEALACHRNGIDFFQVNNIDGFTDQEPGDKEVVIGTIPTGDLNANQPIDFVASAIGGGTNTKTVTVQVDDLNPIKIDAPVPGVTLANGFTLVAHVDKNIMSDVTQFYIDKITPDLEGNQTEVFSLNQLKFDVNSLPEAFTGQVFDVTLVSVEKFYVHFVAIGPNSGRKERTVSYLLNIRPKILDFDVYLDGPHACIEDGGVHLQWQVDNIGEDGEVLLDGTAVPPAYELLGNTNTAGIVIDCKSTVPLVAIRNVQEISGGTTIPIQETADISLDQISINPLNESNTLRSLMTPIFQAQKTGTASGDINSLNWKIQVQEWDGQFNLPKGPPVEFTSGDVGDVASITGDDLGMHYWGNYSVVFKLVAPGPSGVVLSQSEEFFVTYHHPDIVGWWMLDGNAQDSVAPYFNGIASSGGLYTSTNCILDSCLDLFGANEYVYIPVPDESALDPMEGNNSNPGNPRSFTVETWVKFGALDAVQPMIVKDGQYHLILLANNKFEFEVIRGDGTSIFATQSSGVAQLDHWYHVVATFDATDNIPRLYIDGALKATGGVVNSIFDDFGSEDLFFGYDNATHFLNGWLDEVIVYLHQGRNPFNN